MDKQLGKGLSPAEKKQFLADNCEKIEEVGYMKNFSLDELGDMKDRLSDVSIELNDISEEKAEVVQKFKDQMKPFEKEKGTLLTNLKQKAEHVKEECFKFVYEEEGMVAWYNSDGDLVSSRPMMPTEKQKTIFRVEKTGTND